MKKLKAKELEKMTKEGLIKIIISGQNVIDSRWKVAENQEKLIKILEDKVRLCEKDASSLRSRIGYMQDDNRCYGEWI